jgi:hypothetical protein
MTTEPAEGARLEAMIGLVTARYGDRIPTEQMERIRESVTGLRDAMAALYAHPLTNADEPDTTFFAMPGED